MGSRRKGGGAWEGGGGDAQWAQPGSSFSEEGVTSGAQSQDSRLETYFVMHGYVQTLMCGGTPG